MNDTWSLNFQNYNEILEYIYSESVHDRINQLRHHVVPKITQCQNEAPYLVWNLIEVLTVISLFYPISLLKALGGHPNEISNSLYEVQ